MCIQGHSRGWLGRRAPGTEFLTTQAYSGDKGLAVIEHAPFGVIGAITPVTHSLPTITGNAVSMIAGGNAVVVNPHPSGRLVAAEGVKRFNQAIAADIGIDNLICVITEPTLETANSIFANRDVNLICVTGGPAVGRCGTPGRRPPRPRTAAPGRPGRPRAYRVLGRLATGWGAGGAGDAVDARRLDG